MKIDKNYCMNSFLQFRYVHENYLFKENIVPNYYPITKEYTINTVDDLDVAIKKYIEQNVDDKTALMLSSGMDSVILASYMPKGSKCFTLKCIASEPTIDESEFAKKIAEYNNLDHEIIEITWEDYVKYADILLENKKAPFHSIEVQIYKAALRAKELGFNKLLFGESADSVFGGFDGLLSKDWTFDEFVKRFNYVDTSKVLKESFTILEPYKKCFPDEVVNAHKFINKYFFIESVNSYINATKAAGIEYLSPFSYMQMGNDLDYQRVRSGESKYLIRELYKIIYPDLEMNKKIPMPRPMDVWLKAWSGPVRNEFQNDCINYLEKDQKWLVYILEKFLDYFNIPEGK